MFFMYKGYDEEEYALPLARDYDYRDYFDLAVLEGHSGTGCGR